MARRKYDLAANDVSRFLMQIAGHESILYRLESEGNDAGAELQRSIIVGLKRQLEELKRKG